MIILAGVYFVDLSPDIQQSKREKTNNTPQTIKKENLLLDPGFENISQGNWDVAGYITHKIIPIYNNNVLQGFIIENTTIRYHHEVKYDGGMSGYIYGNDSYNFSVYHNWYQKINATELVRENIELSCYIKTRDADDVVLMIQCWSSENLSLDNMIKAQTSKSYYDGINGTNNWEKYSVKLINIPKETKVITVRLGLMGLGEVWFDNAELRTLE